MRIWLVTIGEPLPLKGGDADRLHRTGLFAKLLARTGHKVVWWTSTFDHFRKYHHSDQDTIAEVEANLSIHLLHGCGYQNNLSIRRIRDHRQISLKFAQMARRAEHKPDIILAAFPTVELSREAVKYGESEGIPVVLDMRDMWPDIFVSVVPGLLRPIARIALLSMFKRAQEACSQATAITGITEEFVSWGVKRAGRLRTDLDRAFPMGYAESPPAAEQMRVAEKYWDGLGIRIENAAHTLCFVGSLGRQLDIETVISVAKSCLRLNLPWRFVLCGRGDRLETFKRLARGQSNVIFPGWIDRAQIHVLMRRSAAGLDPMPDRFDFLASINNKAIEYLSAGLPVISCPKRGVLAELLAVNRCGQSYDHGSVNGLLNLLCGITPATLQEMSVNSVKLFQEKFLAEKVYSGMSQYLEEVALGYKSRGRQ